MNEHIRDVCDRFAADGYTAIAPALYDRSSLKNVRLGYTKNDVATGRELREEFSWDDTMLDVEAAVAVLRSEGAKVGTVEIRKEAVLKVRPAPLDAATDPEE